MKNWLASLLNSKIPSNKHFDFDVSSESIDFFCDELVYKNIQKGEADEFLTAQYVVLKMLVEEGLAEPIPNAFIVPHSTIVTLDSDAQALLQLPKIWDGNAFVDIKGTTGGTSFSVSIKVNSPFGRLTNAYEVEGSLIKFGDTRLMLSQQMFQVFSEFYAHAQTSKSESDNLLLLHALQKAQEDGANISLSHFERLDIHVPEKIAVEAEIDSRGNLILSPRMGQKTDHDNLQRFLGQLQSETGRTLKIGNEIILFDEKTAQAAKEIISNRTIPKAQVQQFLKAPSAFLNASLVDLDVGFSVRVKGATSFKHAYFGETDESGINWFAQGEGASSILPIGAIKKTIKTQEDLQQFKSVVADAQVTGATEISFEGKSYDIGSASEVDSTICELEKTIGNQEEDDSEQNRHDHNNDDIDTYNEDVDETIVIDIALNDEELEKPSSLVEKALNEVLFQGELNWDNHKRTPFKHQLHGVKWILGMEQLSRNNELINGALLADDMGLGKTFMSLSAIEHYYRECEQKQETARPTLIVAPLSLLENWKDEVCDTFKNSPFSDIVILQSDGELNRFRVGGTEIKASNIDSETIEPKYSLKFGENYGPNRLDLPKRLVITTYQTLRDYQFSLSLIDWGFIVFDEAQNIKNPNALQTRAAKGLKAKFKLLATGTPVENSLADYWCLMDTACPGYLDSYQQFRSIYITPILQAAGDEIDLVRGTLGRQLREKVGALMLRRVKEDNLDGLPKKFMYVGIKDTDWEYSPKLHGVMGTFQQSVYEGSIKAQHEDDDSHALTTLMRLRDSSLHPRLVEGGRLDAPTSKNEIKILFQESSKLLKVLEIIEEIKARNEKCIIFVVNKRLQRFLSVALGSYFRLGPLSVINGDAKAVAKRDGALTRKSMIVDFENKVGFNIIIMSPVAAGVGLTVVGANNVIHLERHWNPAKEAQATDRIYRIGQKKDVNIYLPILHHPVFESFDVNLHRLLSQKSMLKDAVVTPGEVMPNPPGADDNSLNGDSVISINELKKLSWKQFEAFCVELLKRKYNSENAWLTKDGSDFGADGLLVCNNEAIIIQAKHKQGAYKGHKAVQEISGARELYEQNLGRKIKHQIFITNATKLAKSTREIAQKLSVTVIDGNEIDELTKEYQITFQNVLERLNKERYVIT